MMLAKHGIVVLEIAHLSLQALKTIMYGLRDKLALFFVLGRSKFLMSPSKPDSCALLKQLGRLPMRKQQRAEVESMGSFRIKMPTLICTEWVTMGKLFNLCVFCSHLCDEASMNNLPPLVVVRVK